MLMVSEMREREGVLCGTRTMMSKSIRVRELATTQTCLRLTEHNLMQLYYLGFYRREKSPDFPARTLLCKPAPFYVEFVCTYCDLLFRLELIDLGRLFVLAPG